KTFSTLSARRRHCRPARARSDDGTMIPSATCQTEKRSDLSHASRYETPDRDLIAKPRRPNHCASCAVRFGDHGIIRNIDPVVLKAYPVMAVFCFPVRVRDGFAVRH